MFIQQYYIENRFLMIHIDYRQYNYDILFCIFQIYWDYYIVFSTMYWKIFEVVNRLSKDIMFEIFY